MLEIEGIGDLPGKQVLVANQHGSNGIWNLFKGAGDRIWSIQVDYRFLIPILVRWGDNPFPFIWANGSANVQAFYDGYGRLIKRLPALSELHGGYGQSKINKSVIRMGYDDTEYLALIVGSRMHIFGPHG